MHSHPFEAKLAVAWPPESWSGVRIVVAVSGGPDSVALLRGLQQIRNQRDSSLSVAFLNHGLRAEANDEEAWMVELCKRLDLPLLRERVSGSELAEAGDGLEAAARAARMAFFKRTAEEIGARYIATGHTADDQIETVLFRILRGTGMRGLAGIPRSRALTPSVSLIRPILGMHRAEVIDYLHWLQQDWCEDATNRESLFARNRLRNELLPHLRNEYSASIDDALLRLARQAAGVDAFVRSAAQGILPECVQFGEDEFTVRKLLLVQVEPIVVAEIFREAWRTCQWPEQAMTEAHWDWLVELVTASTSLPARMLPGAIRVSNEGEDKIVLRRQTLASSEASPILS